MDENKPESSADSDAPEFPLFDGGSLFGLERPLKRLWFDRFSLLQRIILTVCVAWVPLAILAAIQGVALGRTQPESFLKDAGMYARFLVALPLLLQAPYRCRHNFQRIMQHFLESGLIRDDERERYRTILSSTMQLRNAPLTDWVFLALAYGYSAYLVAITVFAADFPSSWRALGYEEHRKLTLAGWWFVAVSQPVYTYVVVRFLYRVGLWWNALWQVSHLDLQIEGSHPDGGGGLMFLGLSLRPLEWPAAGLAASLASGLATFVLSAGQPVLNYKYLIGFIAAVITSLFVGPLLFFYNPLKNARFHAWLSHGVAVQEQVRQFERKWIDSRSRPADMLAVQDFSAVIDLNSTVAGVYRMTKLPFQRNQLLELITVALLPFAAVAALQIPLKDIWALFKMLM
ncbi:MAG TPA: hypothetical protein VKF79_08470 [Candidatus Acidoferrum sp.]|nr:hypothetical protein [Candidatus Acidoferrum sp.]